MRVNQYNLKERIERAKRGNLPVLTYVDGVGFDLRTLAGVFEMRKHLEVKRRDCSDPARCN